MIEFTPDQLQAMLPSNKDAESWFDPLMTVLPQFEINTAERVASFIAQCGHESGDFRVLSENLNYSADGLLKVFPKYFKTPEIAAKYARKPELIANRVYGGRMGNGPEPTGEGFKYRGRGLIQLTGKDNYRKCSLMVFDDERFVEDPDLVKFPEGAIQSACWFWTANNLNRFCDNEDQIGLTKAINGGTHGLDDRIARYNRAMSILTGE